MGAAQTHLIDITAANIRQSHIYLNGVAGMFPKDSYGASSSAKGLN